MALRDLGLTAAQERLYLTVLQCPSTSLDALAAAVQLTSDEVQRDLERLVDLGVIRFDPSAPAGISVPPPAWGLGRLIERVEDELMAQYRRVSGTRSELGEIAALGSDGVHHDGDGVEKVDGLAAVRDRIEELSFFARESVYSIQPGGPQSRDALAASRPLDERAVRRHIAMRVIHEASVLDDEVNRANMRELVMAGVQVRVTAGPIERMLIFDEKVAVVPQQPGNSRRGALVVRQPGLVAGFIDLFERAWNDAAELPWETADPASRSSSSDIDEQDRRVLALLASGCTDETAAREIGVSVRHLRRRISRLMQLVGATSRFEAGAEAVRRGWL